MNLHNYERASDYDVLEWLRKEIELTPYQKEKIRDSEIIRLAPFIFMCRRKRANDVWIRLSIILMPLAWLLLFIWLPFNFIIFGTWGYSYERIKWFDKWRSEIGL